MLPDNAMKVAIIVVYGLNLEVQNSNSYNWQMKEVDMCVCLSYKNNFNDTNLIEILKL